MTAPPYGFGFCQEDDRVEAAFLGARPGARLLSIASGGEVPLGLAARGAEVHAVDVVPGQVSLTALKLAAALALEPADAAKFLGYASEQPGRRRAAWPAVRARLDPEAAAFWEAHPDVIDGGAVMAGRFERYLGRILGMLGPVWGRRNLDALCAASGPAEQAAVFDASIGRPWVKTAFWLAFHPAIYGGRGIASEALARRTAAESLGEQYFRWFRTFCTATPAADNWFLQVVLGGGLRDPEAGPDFLRPAGVSALRAAPDRVHLHAAELGAYLRGPVGLFDGFHLSNVGDWTDAPGWDDLVRRVTARAAPGATVLWRELQTERDVPDGVPLVVDRAAGELARAGDRFPFYRLVPGRFADGRP